MINNISNKPYSFGMLTIRNSNKEKLIEARLKDLADSKQNPAINVSDIQNDSYSLVINKGHEPFDRFAALKTEEKRAETYGDGFQVETDVLNETPDILETIRNNPF